MQLNVQLGAVGDHHERPTTLQQPQHLLREPQHRQALARPLRVPEHTELPALFARRVPVDRVRVCKPDIWACFSGRRG